MRGSTDLNGRFDDLNRRLDYLNADVNRRFDAMGADVNRRFDDVRAAIRGLRADHVGFDERLRAVEIALGQVDQRLLTIERVVLPPASPRRIGSHRRGPASTTYAPAKYRPRNALGYARFMVGSRLPPFDTRLRNRGLLEGLPGRSTPEST